MTIVRTRRDICTCIGHAWASPKIVNYDLSFIFRLAKLKGTPTCRPEGVPEDDEPPPPPPPPGGKGKRRASKAPHPTKSMSTSEVNSQSQPPNSESDGTGGDQAIEERWIDYKGEDILPYTILLIQYTTG